MTYDEALEYIHSISWTFCKPGLERTETLCDMLGSPQDSLKFIHVAGTNGKGSFCSMTAKVLEKAGYKVGLYTSPYITRFNERMQVNGVPISDEVLADITMCVKPLAEAMDDKPTEFELITTIAFEFFRRENVDIVVLEAGMGGRLDSTNIIKAPVLSVITGVALDHTAFLGDTVEKIATEKSGIIKKGSHALFGGTDESCKAVIKSRCLDVGCEYHEVDYTQLSVKEMDFNGTVFSYKSARDLRLGLLGSYQPRNACTVLEAIDILRKCGYNISDEAVREGLCEATWPARFELIAMDNQNGLTKVIFDGAHNPEGIESAVESVKQYFKDEKVYVLTGVLKDKDYVYIAKKISEIAEKVFVLTPDNPRALDCIEYAALFSELGIEAIPCYNIENATFAAACAAYDDGVSLVCLGSLYTYCEIVPRIKSNIYFYNFKNKKEN